MQKRYKRFKLFNWREILLGGGFDHRHLLTDILFSHSTSFNIRYQINKRTLSTITCHSSLYKYSKTSPRVEYTHQECEHEFKLIGIYQKCCPRAAAKLSCLWVVDTSCMGSAGSTIWRPTNHTVGSHLSASTIMCSRHYQPAIQISTNLSSLQWVPVWFNAVDDE